VTDEAVGPPQARELLRRVYEELDPGRRSQDLGEIAEAIDEGPARAGDDDEVDVAQPIRISPRPRAEYVRRLYPTPTQQGREAFRDPASYCPRRSRVLAHRRILPAARNAARACAAENASAGAMPGSASG